MIKLPEPDAWIAEQYSHGYKPAWKVVSTTYDLTGVVGYRNVRKLYTEAKLKQVINDALENAAQGCISLQDCGPDNGCCPTYWNEALEKAEIEIRILKEHLK